MARFIHYWQQFYLMLRLTAVLSDSFTVNMLHIFKYTLALTGYCQNNYKMPLERARCTFHFKFNTLLPTLLNIFLSQLITIFCIVKDTCVKEKKRYRTNCPRSAFGLLYVEEKELWFMNVDNEVSVCFVAYIYLQVAEILTMRKSSI